MAGFEVFSGVRASRGRLVSVATLLAASVWVTGCEVAPGGPNARVGQGPRQFPGVGRSAIEPSYVSQLTPEQFAQGAHRLDGPGGAGMVDPVAAVMQGTTQLGSPARQNVVEPTVDWGEASPPSSPSSVVAAAPVRDVYEASVKRGDERIDATAGSANERNGGAAGGNAAMGVGDNGTATPEDTDQATTPLYADPAMLSRADLVAELRRRLATTDAPAVRRALSVSALSLADPGVELGPEVTDDLTPTQLQAVQRYRSLLLEVAQRIDAGDVSELNAKEVARAVSGLKGPEPVTIRNPSLCKRVSGFGVYEPFATTEFIAGQENRMIIYAEVEHFATAAATTANGRPGFEVKLEQEVVLYNEADGLAVWRHDPQPVRDVSRRQRRDFWVVQMVALPANLGVGKYRLKVRVSDLHGGTVDESTLPVRLIADESARTAVPTEAQDKAMSELGDLLEKVLPAGGFPEFAPMPEMPPLQP